MAYSDGPSLYFSPPSEFAIAAAELKRETESDECKKAIWIEWFGHNYEPTNWTDISLFRRIYGERKDKEDAAKIAAKIQRDAYWRHWRVLGYLGIASIAASLGHYVLNVGFH